MLVLNILFLYRNIFIYFPYTVLCEDNSLQDELDKLSQIYTHESPKNKVAY